MVQPLTKRQREVLDCVTRSIAERGYAPTLTEIASAIGVRSIVTVHEHLGNLERKGYLRRSAYNEARSIEVLKHDGICPVCGSRNGGEVST